MSTLYHRKEVLSIGDSEAKRAWDAKNTTFIGLKLNNRQDSEILEYLDGKPKQTEIKRLLNIAIRLEKSQKENP